ncbi:MAG: hypothetical protein ACE5F9_05810 [Phycisphaerae bacterium]
MNKRNLKVLCDVVNLPTAPFVEDGVVEYVRRFVAARPALRLKADRFGNLLVTYTPRPRTARRAKSQGRPVLFAAHMDHPGFCATQMIDARHVRADFRGWVRASFFPGEKVRFYSDGRWVSGRIEKVIRQRPARGGAKRAAASARSFGADAPPAAVVARVGGPVAPGSPGMWALPDATVRGHRLRARMCDDTAGLVGILCMMDAICRRPIRSTCHAFFTRAEEVGFAGALAAVADRTVPKKTIVVAVECSKAIAGVALGAGPVLRVGDKATVFTPAATAYCQVVADTLARRDRAFCFQRKLMDGGTCESTAYCHYGYEATGLCLPLVNYHNMDEARGRIAPEIIDVRDFDNLVKWFVALADSPRTVPYDGRHPGLDERLGALLKRHRTTLVTTSGGRNPGAKKR